MARTPRHAAAMDTATIRVPLADWDELHQVAGDQRPEVVRQLIALYLGRPGASMPARPPVRPEPKRRPAARAAAAAMAARSAG